MKNKQEFDYVVVGAGSAGCVIAHRLAEAGHSVCLLEAGSSNFGAWDSWKIHMPSAITYVIGEKKYNWDYYTVPQSGLNDRKLHQPRGKVLGGSSSINAMVYIRGHAEDYQRWARITGEESWQYEHVLRYFKKSQMHSLGGNEFRGDNGPLKVSRTNTKEIDKLNQEFVNAGLRAGYPYTDDMNGRNQEGFGPMDMTIDPIKGNRASTAYCYLDYKKYPFLKNKLTIKVVSLVTKLIFKKANLTTKGIEVEGIEYIDKNGIKKVVHSSNEVIICAGAVGSPQLLQLSGIGDKYYLKNINIDPVLHLPDVGENLSDHLEFYLQYLCKKPISLAPYVSTYTFSQYAFRNPLKTTKIALEWFLFKRGICASNQFEVGGFIRSDYKTQDDKSRDNQKIIHPDIQLHFTAVCASEHLNINPEHGYQSHIGSMRPTSRGTIKISSNDPRAAPLIDPNYLSTVEDCENQRKAFRLALEIMDNFNEEYKGRIYNLPSDLNIKNDGEIDNWIRKTSHSAYHLCGSNAMGKVVDPKSCKVYGSKNLRVIDASIMPDIISGNLNASVIMIAEKLSDIILEKSI